MPSKLFKYPLFLISSSSGLYFFFFFFFFYFKLGKTDMELAKKWLFLIGNGTKFCP